MPARGDADPPASPPGGVAPAGAGGAVRGPERGPDGAPGGGGIVRLALARPALCVGLLTAVLRVAIVLHMRATNPLIETQQLDGDYYLRWAADIAAGDIAGRGGTVGGEPWFFNPLYAYLLAPVARWQPVPLAAICVAQALLGALTAALAAGAAHRLFGLRAAWVAGLLVAFAAPLAELDAHLSVAELSAFLVAGACFACAPPLPGDRRWAHGPVAAALWLGIGALARPITPVALPFVAWRYARESPRRLRTAALVAAVFFACAVPSLARNWAVSGEPALYTAAGGVNAHLGNNAEAKKFRGMTTPHFRFSPELMHDDARWYVAQALGRIPTRGEVSSFFWRMTLEETFARDPWGSFAFYANKARWFFAPVEVPSSASLATDLRFSAGLGAAFVPTWLVASLALAGAWAWRRRPEVLLGPGALALAHVGVLTLVFPLSHYRAPGIPALAVLAGGAVAAAWDAWGARRRMAAAGIVAVGAAVAVAGACPPQPDPLWFRDEAILAMHAKRKGDIASAHAHALAALEAYRRQWPGEKDPGLAWELIAETEWADRRWEDALKSLDRSLELDPHSPTARITRSWVHERLLQFRQSEEDAREVMRRYPFLPDAWVRLGEVLSQVPGKESEAAEVLREAIRRGGRPDEGALRRARLPPLEPSTRP